MTGNIQLVRSATLLTDYSWRFKYIHCIFKSIRYVLWGGVSVWFLMTVYFSFSPLNVYIKYSAFGKCLLRINRQLWVTYCFYNWNVFTFLFNPYLLIYLHCVHKPKYETYVKSPYSQKLSKPSKNAVKSSWTQCDSKSYNPCTVLDAF